MNLSIIVTSYRNPHLLKLCLESIKTNVTIPHELFVADSETEEDTAMLMREDFPEVIFFPHQENVGFQALVRKGLEAASGKYLLLLNGDIIVTPDSVQHLMEFIQNRPRVGMVGPGLLNFNGTLQPSCFRFYRYMTIVYRRTFLGRMPFAKRELDRFLMKDYDQKEARGVDWLMGSAMLLSREAVEKVGPMDPRFFMYMEDVDWCRRFWEQGFQVVYFPHSRMYHYHGKGSGKGGFWQSILLNKYTWIHIISGLKYF